jgi:cytochrome c-type biogenesis protein CcmE
VSGRRESQFKMSSSHHKRLLFILLFILSISVAAGLILFALKQNINLFYTPTEVATQKIKPEETIRLGGMVKKGSIQRGEHLTIQFIVTDFNKEVSVSYTGILPDLFREGQGVVVSGMLQNKDHFQAHEVLAKHDENYMPVEIKNVS